METTKSCNDVKISGAWWDWVHPLDGSMPYLLQHGHNIITNMGLALAAGALGIIGHGIKTWQVGAGDPDWDTVPPPEPDGIETTLVDPVLEKTLSVRYWDVDLDTFSAVPTNVLDARIVLNADEANGDLREFGIRGAQSGIVLFNYVIHGKITKTDTYNLERIMRFTIGRA
jgi:hypothetical protein